MREHIAVYIMANDRNGTLYTGVAGNVITRTYQHKAGSFTGFTKKYGLKKLVYFELHETMESAIHREKRIKKYTRKQKLNLIESLNPEWNDLYNEIAGSL